jgi:hypothetical protein
MIGIRQIVAMVTRRESQTRRGGQRDRSAPIEVKPIAPPHEPDAVRLAHICEACVQGQVAGAELELYAWRREPDCPVAAQVLLATLLARRDQLTDAIAVLPHHDQLAGDDDAQCAMLLISLFVTAGYYQAARHLIGRLHRDLGCDQRVIDWIALLQMPGSTTLPAVSQRAADELGAQLLRQPQVIPALVAAQRIDPDPRQVALLRQSLNRIARDVIDDEQTIMLHTAQAQLALLAGDGDDARRWAHRGLRMNPYAAPLALALADVSDDQAIGPPAGEVLRRVSEKHPNYLDVRRALIRREYRDGHRAAARMRLQQWLDADPQSPLAGELAREIAA